MANVKIYNVPKPFCANFTVSEKWNFIVFYLQNNRSRSWSAIVTITPFDGKCKNLQMSPRHLGASCSHFALALTVSDINFPFLSSKSRSRSWSAFSVNIPFDSKCPNLQMSPTNLCNTSHHFRDIKISFLHLQKVGPHHGSVIVAITPFDGMCQNLQMSSIHFVLAILQIQRYKNFKFLKSKKYVTECNFRN